MTRLRNLGCTKFRNKKKEIGLVQRNGKRRQPWGGLSTKKFMCHLRRGYGGRKISLSLYLWVGTGSTSRGIGGENEPPPRADQQGNYQTWRTGELCSSDQLCLPTAALRLPSPYLYDFASCA